jgi:hypothetical protein
VGEADVVLKCRRHIVYDKICKGRSAASQPDGEATLTDATHLVHELHPICEEDSTSCLDTITFEDLPPFVFAVLAFQFDRFEDFSVHFMHLFVFWTSIPNIAENLERLILAIVIVEPS